MGSAPDPLEVHGHEFIREQSMELSVFLQLQSVVGFRCKVRAEFRFTGVGIFPVSMKKEKKEEDIEDICNGIIVRIGLTILLR